MEPLSVVATNSKAHMMLAKSTNFILCDMMHFNTGEFIHKRVPSRMFHFSSKKNYLLCCLPHPLINIITMATKSKNAY